MVSGSINLHEWVMMDDTLKEIKVLTKGKIGQGQVPVTNTFILNNSKTWRIFSELRQPTHSLSFIDYFKALT